MFEGAFSLRKSNSFFREFVVALMWPFEGFELKLMKYLLHH